MLTFQVKGPNEEVKAFLKHFEMQPYYQIMQNEEEELESNTIQFRFLQTLLKPSLRQSFWVELTTLDQEKVRIHLLDGDVVNMGNGCTLIYGKNYDIFASKKTPCTESTEGKNKEGLILL